MQEMAPRFSKFSTILCHFGNSLFSGEMQITGIDIQRT